jgi:hypothetical protein
MCVFGVRGVVAALAAAVMLGLSPTAAEAKWLKAEAEPFIIYSEGGEPDLRAFASKLVAFDYMLRKLHGAKPPSAPRRKLEIYLVRDGAEMRRIVPGASDNLRGVYRASTGSVHAVSTRDSDPWLAADEVLFHEYAHHFMLANYPGAYPAWVVEGYADYFSTARIRTDVIEIGRPSEARASWVANARWISYRDVLSAPLTREARRRGGEFYAQSWLMVHYLMSSAERAQQLGRALEAIAAGEPAVDAMVSATGMTTDRMTGHLQNYIRNPVQLRQMPNPIGAAAPVTITEMPASADDMLLESVALANPLNDVQAGMLLRRVRARASRHPGDSLAELTLARAELGYGEAAAGEAVLRKRLAADPGEAASLQALGLARLAAGRKDEARRAELFGEARPLLLRANQADPNDFRTLYGYVQSRAGEAGYPNEDLLEILLLASDLAPSVSEIRLEAGRALIKHRHYAQAEEVLGPLANNPHGGKLQAAAAALVAEARRAQGKAAPEAEPENDATEPAA